MADPNRDVEPNGAHVFVLPPRHRLFVIFDDVIGRQAVEESAGAVSPNRTTFGFSTARRACGAWS